MAKRTSYQNYDDFVKSYKNELGELIISNFPASGQKIHLFNLQKQNPNKL